MKILIKMLKKSAADGWFANAPQASVRIQANCFLAPAPPGWVVRYFVWQAGYSCYACGMESSVSMPALTQALDCGQATRPAGAETVLQRLRLRRFSAGAVGTDNHQLE